MGALLWIEHLITAIFILMVVNIWFKKGLVTALSSVWQAFRMGVPGAEHLFVQSSSSEFIKQISSPKTDPKKPPKLAIPEKGIAIEELLKEMKDLKEKDIVINEKKSFTPVVRECLSKDCKAILENLKDNTGAQLGKDVGDSFVAELHHAYMRENPQNPTINQSLRKFENEIISMTASMLHGDADTVGSLTSGGTESLLMAMKTYRDRARKLFPHIKKPEMVAPLTIHPAHEKAAYYFGFTINHVPVGEDFRPDPKEYEKAITPNTICLLCSAPQFCHGVVDPIPELSEIALRRGLPLHVDSCFGGFMLPWVEKLGYTVPTFDFRLQGVTSISADIHKYGFGPKGGSILLFRNEAIRKYQIFSSSDWPGGLFASPSMAGTRPAGNIAGCWVTMKAIGQDGYLKIAKQLMDTTNKLKDAIAKIPGICVMGKPHMTCIAIGSEDPDVDLLVFADELENRGWKPERQQNPACIHCSIMPHHNHVVDQLIQEMKEAAAHVKKTKSKETKGNAAVYGMVTKVPDKGIIDDFIVEFFSQVYKT